MLNCYGFTTDANGTLNTVLIADGDDGTTMLRELLIKEVNGKLVLYRSSSSPYIKTSTYIDGVSYINTPEVLQNMLKEYRSLDEAAVWNGKETNGVWETQVDVVDSNIADEKTGWDVLVNGDSIDEKHHGYYHPRFAGHLRPGYAPASPISPRWERGLPRVLFRRDVWAGVLLQQRREACVPRCLCHPDTQGRVGARPQQEAHVVDVAEGGCLLHARIGVGAVLKQQ